MPTSSSQTAGTPAPGYQVKFETCRIGGEDYPIRSLLDRQQFSDPHGLAQQAGVSSATWPLFGVVWPSALELAKLVDALPLAGKRILEVGCGLALASLVAHRHGADITASDVHPLAGAFLLENIALNRMSPLPYANGDWASPDTGLGSFDLIIGSDLLYERDQPGILSQFIHRHSNPRVEVIIIDPDRGNRGAFNREMTKLGYNHSETRLLPTPDENAPAYKGRALNYRRDTTETSA